MSLIILRSGNPLKFVANAHGRYVNVCTEDKADRFPSEAEARTKLVDWNQHGHSFEMKQVEPMGRELFASFDPREAR